MSTAQTCNMSLTAELSAFSPAAVGSRQDQNARDIIHGGSQRLQKQHGRND